LRLGPGDTITVVIDPGVNLASGDRYLFFTYGLVAGRSIAVREVARASMSGDTLSTRFVSLLDSARAYLADQRLKSALERSSIVAIGAVDSVRPLVPSSAGGEHSSNWIRAWVRLSSVFKRDSSAAPDNRVIVVFPGSRDRIFAGAARLSAGASYLLLSRRTSALATPRRIGLDATATYFVADSLDALPPADSVRVKRILR
jgi:hypothetical protein